MNPRPFTWLPYFLLCASLATAAAQTVSLSSLQPTSALSYYIKNSAAPRPKNIDVPGMQGQQAALAFLSSSEVAYAIPSGQTAFSATIVYTPPPRPVPGGPTYNVPMVLQLLADNKIIWEQFMDATTPPVSFTVPVRGASALIMKSTATFVGTEFYLLNAGFHAGAAQPSAEYLVAPGVAFVDPMPLARQALVHVYFPGEEVPVSVWYGGTISQAAVQINLTPQFGNQEPIKSLLTVPMRQVRQGLASGSAVWKVPARMGPARMEVAATGGGKSLFQRAVDIAIMRSVNVASIQDNDFGVQVSTAGFPMAYDQFASLWGAKWGRTFAHWSIIEATQGKYDFSRLDSVIDTYRSQGMRFMPVLGEDAPDWVGYPGTASYFSAWKQYVAATVKHFQGRVDTWDVFNEINAKVNAFQGKATKDWQLDVLKTAIETIHATAPGSTVVCCSTGIQYQLGLAQAGVFSGVDVVSIHPYQTPPPEVKNGAFNYAEIMAALKGMVGTYGVHKPVWGTEATWAIGPANSIDVTAPGLSEQKQADYFARVGMLSVAIGSKYFIHSPFYSGYHPQPQLPGLAAFAQMASLFSDVTQAKMLSAGPSVFGVTAESRSGRVSGLWTVSGPATVRLQGGENYRFMDMYGNPLSVTSESLPLSPDPIYFTSSGVAPQVEPLTQSTVQWKALPRPGSWTCNKGIGTTCTSTPSGLHVQTDVSKSSLQLTSPPVEVPANSCITIRVPILVEKGAVQIAAMDPATRGALQKRQIPVDPPLPGVSQPSVDLSVQTGSVHSISVIVSTANTPPAQSVFLMSGPPQIAACQE
ncbi:MAG TPA: endo-1,4-beta-xylanase [Terriglobales bacterium]